MVPQSLTNPNCASGCSRCVKVIAVPSIIMGTASNQKHCVAARTDQKSRATSSHARSNVASTPQIAKHRCAASQRSASWPTNGAINEATPCVALHKATCHGEKPSSLSRMLYRGRTTPGTAYCRNIRTDSRASMVRIPKVKACHDSSSWPLEPWIRHHHFPWRAFQAKMIVRS